MRVQISILIHHKTNNNNDKKPTVYMLNWTDVDLGLTGRGLRG